MTSLTPVPVSSNQDHTLLHQSFSQALAFYKEGHFDLAEKIYQKIIALKPDYFPAWHLLAVIAHEKKAFAQAINLISLAIFIEPHNAAFYTQRGQFQSALQCFREAIFDYDHAISIDPLYGSAYALRGIALAAINLHQKALMSYDKAISQQKGDADTYFNRALSLGELGQLTSAIDSYNQALQIKNDFAEAYTNRGAVMTTMGQTANAIASHQQAIAINPHLVFAYCHLAHALQMLGHGDLALIQCERATTLEPYHPPIYVSQALILMGLKRFTEALARFNVALALEPDNAEIFSNRSLALNALGQHTLALDSCSRALRLKPHWAPAYANRGQSERALHLLEAAQLSCERAIQLDPHLAEAHLNLATVLIEQTHFPLALKSLERALELKTPFAQAHYNRGICFLGLDQIDWAIDAFNQALKINADYTDAFINRGLALERLHQLDEALQNYQQALSLLPDCIEAHWNKSLTLLLRGDYPTAWPLYEWRWRRQPLKSQCREFSQPLWLGEENLQGKTLLIHCEQGLGDTLQFSRFVPRLLTLAKHVIFELPAPLFELLQSLPGSIQFIPHGQTLPAFDYHCPLMSLPLALSVHIDDLEPTQTYLSPPKEKINLWHERVKSHQKPLIGLAWRGNPEHLNDAKRSLALRDIIDKLPSHVTWISLQAFINDEEKKILQNQDKLVHFEEGFESFSSTAALCMNLSAVVSVDTSIAHLAGALGLPLSLLLPFNPDWRWLLNRSDSPWYKTARLYRQPAPGQWAPAIDDLLQDLQTLFFVSPPDHDRSV